MVTKTKSKLFSTLDLTRDENFAKDLGVFSSLPNSAIERLAEYALKLWVARGDTEKETAGDRASRELKVPRAHLDHALRLSTFLMSRFLKDGEGHNDKPENIVSDMETIFGISFGEKRGSFQTLVKGLKKLAEQKGDLKTRQDYTLRSLPVLTAVSISADYRLMFDKKFESGGDLSSYQPKCLDAIPIAVVQLDRIGICFCG